MESQQSNTGKGAAYPNKHRRNYPRSKNGCLTCRGKRKKCDETKPQCKACVRSVQACVWSSDDKQDSQNNSNSDSTPPTNASSELTNRGVKKSEAKRSAARQSDPAIAELSLAMVSLSTTESQVFRRFLFDWATSAEISAGYTMSWFAHLPDIYANASMDSLVHKSVNALASASFGQRFNSAETLMNANKWYGKAIHMLKIKVLSIKDSSSYCDVMSAIVLLGIYESLMIESVALEGSWVSHASGASALLHMRGQDKIMKSPAEFEVSAICFLQMILSSLLTGQAPPIPWSSIHELGLPKIPYFYAHIEHLYQAACLFAEWRTALMNYEEDDGLQRLCDVATKALSFDKRFEGWAHNPPPSFEFSARPLSVESQPQWLQPLLSGPWRPLKSHKYASLMIEILWRFYWMVRAIVNQALLFTDGIFEQSKEPDSPIAPNRTAIEHNALSFTDRLCESCLSNFVEITEKAPENKGAGDRGAEAVPSLLGYLILHILPTIGLCFEQIVIPGVDLSGRREWVAKMRHFLRVNFGIAKGATAIPPSHVGKISIQTWGLPHKLADCNK